MAMEKKGKTSHKHAGRNGNVPPEETRWRAGQTGNPNGRPISRPITAAIRELLDKDDGAGIKALARVGMAKALKGDVRFWKELMDRVDGKVLEQILLGGSVGVQLPERYAEFLDWLASKEKGPKA